MSDDFLPARVRVTKLGGSPREARRISFAERWPVSKFARTPELDRCNGVHAEGTP